MNLLVISRHDALVERLRMAFEGAGHRVLHARDPLAALADDPWERAHVVLVDAQAEPLDGYRLCRLLRGEARVLFSNLPLFLVLDHPPREEDLAALQASEADGYIEANYSIQQLLNHFHPVLEGAVAKGESHRVPLLALGLHPRLDQQVREILHHYQMEPHAPLIREAPHVQRDLKAPAMLLGLSAGGVQGALGILAGMRESGSLPYTILVGRVREEAAQRKLLLAGVSDWVGLPLSGPRLLHACRRAIEWVHIKHIQAEYEAAIHDLSERRNMLEMEASALRSEVLTDPLTELLNRRAFDQNLEHAFHQWERHRRTFVLLMGDIDHFKLINDRFGHPIGDAVLKEFAGRLRSSLRKSDLAFRIGGEEFAVLLPETSLKAGTDVADKLRRRIEEEPFVLPGGQTIFPSISFGVGGAMELPPGALVAAVDRALYQAKALGRNRVVVAQEGEANPSLSSGS